MKSFSFSCELPNGVHARPASHVEAVCNGFDSSITWQNQRTGMSGNAKSVLSLISTDTLLGDECLITIEGQDEDSALTQLKQFITNEFPHCDAPLATTTQEDENLAPLPRNFSNLNVAHIRGRSVSEGFGQGVLTAMGAINFDAFTDLPPAKSLNEERSQLNSGLEAVVKSLTIQLNSSEHTEGEVLKAHLSIAKDEEFRQTIASNLVEGRSSADAIIATAKHFGEVMKNSSSAYMRERELDIRDVCYQLLQSIYGDERFGSQNKLTQPTVCLADDLTPSQFLELDKSLLKGLILSHGGNTSHTVILARSFAIPTIVGVEGSRLTDLLDEEVVVDGTLGIVVTEIAESVERYYVQESKVKEIVSSRQAQFRDVAAQTFDGKVLEVAANIAHSVEAKAAFANGAEAVGLFRTEMLYMDRTCAPDEDELYNIFCQACDAANGKSIIVRTIDIGGDKPVDYLNIPAENNPFLGYRAVRIYPEFIEMFKTQLRAILRASAHGNLKIMIPMISSLEEILWVKDILAEVRQELRKEALPFAEKVPLGIMLEVPSVAFIIDQCCEEIDFFSIGSNDLTQYLMAVDRDNAKVAASYNSLNPAFLRTLDHVVREVHRHGKWIGLCGELGAKGSVLPLLVGLGLDEISMSSPSIPATKERIAKLDSRECRQLLNKAMQCRTIQEVEHVLAQFRMTQSEAPMVSADCISLDRDLRNKEEVIKTLSDNLFLTGRCRYPNKLADDLWAREDVFSTGLGFGFAIPHTKSEHIEQSAISVCRLAKSIEWGDEEAQFVIMLTLNKHAAGDQHMKIFSKLARKIMHADFRDQLMTAETSYQIEALLKQELELN
ncbi:phosphoenolpyruvate--protein phosphotransferase [Vibrio harveyi]|uniref:Phosphoenolpyruvate--protein phosphotransferase n=1 Tax=Vibrio harveyi TaxID=669 RepID=A0A8B3DLH4_VIBHA|nr:MULTISPECIES: phosphoenolpyruvate--protein phosphotransferase [Vibrio]AIV05101.1 PTS fructose transporter subunit IIA [Vibrio harveyi]EKO3797841.1 phosphoenolpyruvate--protein phosphotransferase [Vibrio harveyi]EKO3806085.1 phosphoenolpyruvate--protein phosphotransferase [Vibrio harveyi]EKO3812355.1 phosphoenolpyruvate--protein phosphotransferase [Vibrio harveyi]EKO3834809.1 phosphoenolpyruvate--protein phosphotransferase [Vibrio harveyi]